jgi:phage terminase large subunit
VDEAEPVTETAWEKAIPSVREHDSEIWVTWNPERKSSATHKRFRLDPPAGAKIVEVNWRDNPWFPAVLEAERLEDLEKRPDNYEHVWEGGFKTVTEGAYYAKQPGRRETGRADQPGPSDPLMSIRACLGHRRNGRQGGRDGHLGLPVHRPRNPGADYYEAQGQPMGEHVQWLREHGYEKAQCVLPHDGANGEKVYSVSYESALRDAGFNVRVIPNQGRGAASFRVEASRRLFPRIWFNETTTEAGRDALGAYHEKRDEERNIGLGPNHDWSSHGSDAFGLMCVDYDEPKKTVSKLELPRQTFV